jgi:AcrR family transcriptional regulator
MDKKSVIIIAAKALFQRFGFKKVSVEEIVQQAEVSKATFYKYFRNKTDVAAVALEELFKEDRNVFYKTVKDPGLSFDQKIRRLIDLKEEIYRTRSDFFYSDLEKGMPEIKEVADRYRREMMEALEVFIADAKEKGYLRQSLNIKFLSQIITLLFEEGLRNKRFSHIPDKADFVREVSELIFYGILKKTEE